MATRLRSASVDLSLLSDQVYELFKSEILAGSLRSGERVTVSGLAARIGLSPTPVRDALRRLSTDGLVDVLPRRGTIVAAFDARSIGEIFHIRRIIECAAADELPSAPEAILIQMFDLAKAMEALRTEEIFSDYDAFSSLDTDFHRCITKVLENRRLSQFYETLRWPIMVVRALSRSPFQRAQATVAEHEDIAQAFRLRDVPRAKEAIIKHLRNAEADLLQRRSGDARGGS
ncbi:MAG TPA: GntR family transcriptional regulator [bacterium]|nr:GntR family transcriptional regulator [bacterium]